MHALDFDREICRFLIFISVRQALWGRCTSQAAGAVRCGARALLPLNRAWLGSQRKRITTPHRS
jgi:hypothetical protein